MQVPSALYLTDVLLYLDKFLKGNSLLAKPGTTEASLSKTDLAAKEAQKLKKLVSALRYLFRNSAPATNTPKHIDSAWFDGLP